MDCLSECGKIVYGAVSSDDTDTSSEDEIEDEIASSTQQQEEYNIRGLRIMECISKDSVIALFSPSSSFELFYLCHVYDFGIAQENMKDDSDHIVFKGQPFIKCKYYDKISEKSRKVQYCLLLNKFVYVHPAQVLSPCVSLNTDCFMSIADYQWLCDSI